MKHAQDVPCACTHGSMGTPCIMCNHKHFIGTVCSDFNARKTVPHEQPDALTATTPPPHEDVFPETIVHAHLDGRMRKYIPVDGVELQGLLSEARTIALEDAAILADTYAAEMRDERNGEDAPWHELSREREGAAKTCALRIRQSIAPKTDSETCGMPTLLGRCTKPKGHPAGECSDLVESNKLKDQREKESNP